MTDSVLFPSQPLAARQKFAVLLCASATSSLIMLDTNVVAVSLPSIARDLHTGFASVQWVISAYLVTFAALLLPAGSLADLHGRRRMVMVGLTAFMIASAACGLAASVAALEIARAAQGIAGSLLLTSALAIISATFGSQERPKAFAFWGTCIGLALTCGPIVGGIITGVFGWRWAFLVNVPLCIAFLVAIRQFVSESQDPEARHFDGFGVVTLSGGLFALTAALIDGNRVGWGSSTILLRGSIAIVFIVAFIVVERSQRRPMLDLRLLRQRMFLGAAFGTFGFGASAQVMIFFLPIYLQGAFGFSPLTSGFAMLPFAVPFFLAPRIAASLLRGWSHRRALLLGLGITMAANILLALLAQLGSYSVFSAAMLVAGAGAGVLNPESAKSMQAQISSDRAGMASGVGATVRFVSLLLGVALLGAVLAHFRPAFAAGVDLNAAHAFRAVAFAAAGLASIAFSGTAIFMAPRAPARIVDAHPPGRPVTEPAS